jgi:hypothetical protein
MLPVYEGDLANIEEYARRALRLAPGLNKGTFSVDGKTFELDVSQGFILKPMTTR